MADASLDQDVVARLDRLLADLPPDSADPTEFLLARFDAGLAWIADPVAAGVVEERGARR